MADLPARRPYLGQCGQQHLVRPLRVLLRRDIVRRLQGERVNFGQVYELDDVDSARAGSLELVQLVVLENDVPAIDGITADQVITLDTALARRTEPVLTDPALALRVKEVGRDPEWTGGDMELDRDRDEPERDDTVPCLGLGSTTGEAGPPGGRDEYTARLSPQDN
jgi:hypothetical protein